ncbi:sigma-54-dependent transcriptional regulator [Thermosulfuriphilus sp.]
MKKGYRILVVDDEVSFLALLENILREEGYSVEKAADPKEALKVAEAFLPHLVITDLKMPEMDGHELMKALRQRHPETDFIVITAFGSIESAVRAMKEGAFDYLSKPLSSPDELRAVVAKAYERYRLVRENLALKAGSRGLPPLEIIFAGMESLLEDIKAVAPTKATVLLLGESGTGKTLVARVIHELSGREGPFVEINCAALPENLIEAELFGYEKGAFTGAVKGKKGRFELADEGTVFLDEVAELPQGAQAKLLRVLQDGTFERLGGLTTIKTDVRLIAATNRDLAKMVTNGRFREDLFFRLNVFPLEIPPLRQRSQALPELIDYLLWSITAELGKEIREIDPEGLEALKRYHFPGNIRELRNILERAVILSRDGVLRISLGQTIPRRQDSTEIPAANLKEIERRAIEAALKKTGGHRRKAAELLGISLRTLHYKIKAYDIKL